MIPILQLIPHRIIIYFIMLILTYSTGYIKGKVAEQENEKLAETKILVKTKEIVKVVEKEVEKKITDIQVKYIPIEKEITEYVKLDKHSNNIVDDKFISLFNESTKNPNTRSTTNINEENSRSEIITNGKLIETINYNNKLYYECKTIVESWQEYYLKLQEQYNK